jgi:hypothetical protein
MPEKTKHRMKTNKTKNIIQKTKKITSTDARKNKTCVLFFLASVLVIF